MSKLHVLKLKGKSLCDAVFEERKTYELRYNDRDFQVGDYVLMTAIDDDLNPIDHPVNEVLYKITFISGNREAYPNWLQTGYCCFSIKPVTGDELYKAIQEVLVDNYATGVYNKLNRNAETVPKQEIIDVLSQYISKDSIVLDIGCGNCIPYGKWMFDYCKYYRGIDVSADQCAEADKVVPCVHIICNDYLDVDFNHGIDVAVFLYVFFYFTADKQVQVLQKIYNELSDDGNAIILLRNEVMAVQGRQEWCGSPMLWSHTGVSFVLEAARSIGFDTGCRQAEFKDSYSWIFLRKVKR